MEQNRKAIILGMDGATFDLLLPLVEQGKMPNLAAMLQRGTWGELRSTTPPFSAQAWVSMATGKNPARHGVVDFWERTPGMAPGERRGFVTARQIHGEPLWQIAGRHGLRAGIVNVPVTYPPRPLPGYLVSGFLTPQGRDDYVYPLDLRDEILGLVPGYEPDPFDPLTAGKRQILEIESWMARHEKVARHLATRHPVDLFFSVVQALDHLQHLFWNEIAGESGEDEIEAAIDRCYRLADEIIGHRLSLLDEQTNLFLVSDHGFGPARKWFHVNRFLQEQDLLALGEIPAGGAARLLTRLGLTPHSLRAAIRRLDLLGLRRVVGRLARVNLGRRIDESLTRPIDWARTRAISGSPATEGIWLNVRGRDPQGIVEPGAAYEALREHLADSLRGLRDAETGQPVVAAVYRREELYEGPFLSQLPDLVFDLGEEPYLASDSLAAPAVLEPLPKDLLQGRHRPMGVLAAAGPDIAAGGRIEEARIVDIAPTVLYALGLPIPDDMDGHPLLQIFSAEFRRTHPRYEEPVTAEQVAGEPVYDELDQEEMERRLRGLGYVS